MNINSVINNLKNMGAVFPLEWRNALKYRGVGPVTIRGLVKLGLVTFPVGEQDGLSTRAIGCLEMMGIRTKGEALERIQNGTLGVNKQGCRNYGLKTEKEICAWVGIPVPMKHRKPFICPHCGKDVYGKL